MEHDTLPSEEMRERVVANLYRRYHNHPRVTEALCEDAFSEAVFRTLRINTVVLDLESWLTMAARNQMFDWVLRGKNSSVMLSFDELKFLPADVAPTALEQLEQQETVAQIHRALDAIPAQWGQVVKRRCFDEEDYLDIARDLGISHHAVKMRMVRGKRALRRALMDNPHFDTPTTKVETSTERSGM